MTTAHVGPLAARNREAQDGSCSRSARSWRSRSRWRFAPCWTATRSWPARSDDRDAEVDRREVEVEEECLKILALHQPVAIDLRFIVAALKINNDLERIGDLAVNIARKAEALAAATAHGRSPSTWRACRRRPRRCSATASTRWSTLDATLADDVCRARRRSRPHEARIRREVERDDRRTIPTQTKPLLRCWPSRRNLERIADLATNIAEDVIYMIEGKIVRHQERD